MACNPPSYPPQGSTGWGEALGTAWSSKDWDAYTCLDIIYDVSQPLTIDYTVPQYLSISYDVLYSAPLTVEFYVSQYLTVEYQVVKELTVSYSVPYSQYIDIYFSVSPGLNISYDVTGSEPINITYDVNYGFALDITFRVPPSLLISYTVPDAYQFLQIEYNVPANYRALVVSYDVSQSHRLFVSYSVESRTSISILNVWYSAIQDSISIPLNISYSTSSSSTSGDGVVGEDIAAGLISLSINASEGSININASVIDSHPWASASVGDVVGGYIGGEIFTFKIMSKSYDTVKCEYSISGRATVADLLNRVINTNNNNIWVPDPVRVAIEEAGYICVDDLDIRNNVSRPNVMSAIYAAARDANVDIEVDPNIPGLSDKVPFDAFYNRDELTLADVLNTLIGWSRPYYFLSGDKVRVVGGHPAGAVGTPPTTGNYNTRTEKYYELPRSVNVNGGPWPDSPQQATPSGDGCGAGSDPEPSEADDYTLHDRVTTSVDSSLSNVLSRTVEKIINKRGGKVVSEREYVYINYIRPIIVGTNIVGYQPESSLAEYTITTYTYAGGCKDALAKKSSKTYRTSLSLLESPLEFAIYAGYDLGDMPFLYKSVNEEWVWGRKAYVEKYNKTTTTAVQIVGTTVRYISELENEIWLPFGDGLWFHRRSYTKRRNIEMQLGDSQVDLTLPSNYRRVSHSSQEVESEITDTGPMTSNCLNPPPDCGVRCDSVTSANEGLTRYSEVVSTGGSASSISINVPGINSYWPLPAVLPNSGSAPPMNIGSVYADYAAKSRKETGRISVDYVLCLGDSGGSAHDLYIDSEFKIPGSIVNGGLVIASNLKIDSNGKATGSYELVYFA